MFPGYLVNLHVFEVDNYDEVLCVCISLKLREIGKKKILCSEHVSNEESSAKNIRDPFVMFQKDDYFVGSGALKPCPEIPLVNNNNRKYPLEIIEGI